MTNIHINKTFTGTLKRNPEDARTIFEYTETTKDPNIVSLLMPPSMSKTWNLKNKNQIHPIFAMNLPEGTLRQTLEKIFLKTLPDMDDLTLFTITGRSQIGRIRCHPNTEKIDDVQTLPLKSLLKVQGNQEMHRQLLERFARYSGISGAQPKIMVRDEDTLETQKTTVQGNTHIVKFFDPKTYPALAQNEFLCLTAAKNAGLQVPKFWLSDDTLRLIVKRFDTNPDGNYTAFEDGCSLANLQPQDKYKGSYEQMAKTLKTSITEDNRADALKELFRALVFAVLTRNGDAHRKNFGVTYNTPKNVRLAPFFDLVTTTPYLPHDLLALQLNGTKRWPGKKTLVTFGQNFCDLSGKEADEITRKTQDAVTQTKGTIKNAVCQTPDKTTAATLKTILTEWENGLLSLQPTTIQIPFDTKRTNHPQGLHSQKPPEENPNHKPLEPSPPPQSQSMGFNL
jgi:serine/threonine-protein kinase HipA